MSAYLDKSQGITFVYSNIYDLYIKAKEAKLDSPFVLDRAKVLKSETANLNGVQSYEPKEFVRPQGVVEAEALAKENTTQEKVSKASGSISNLQKNLKDLSDAHERLRFLLQELDALTKKK